MTFLDYFVEFVARLYHPRVRMESVTQGCPRPMTWVWFDGQHAPSDAPKSDAPEVVILYLHGGGYWAFTGKSHLEYVTRIIKAYNKSTSMRTKACIVDLRRAPEHPWPAPLEDALAAYEFLQHGSGYDASKIIFAGDSAGGGLCLCTLMAIRDAKKPLPLCVTVISPFTDLARAKGQFPDEAGLKTDFLCPEAVTFSAKYYLTGLDEDAKHPLISPKYGQLHALPPILIQTGESELLARDSIEFARRLEVYGGTVQLEMYPEMPHVFPMFEKLGLEDAATAVQQQANFVKGVLSGQHSARRLKIMVHNDRTRSFENLRTQVSKETCNLTRFGMTQATSSPNMRCI